MITLVLGDMVLGIPSELLGQALFAGVPGWLSGKEKPDPTQQAFKIALKALIPLIMGLIQRDIERKGAAVPLPNLKCREAKENIIMYALGYLVSNGLALAENQVFYALSEVYADGSVIITGLATDPDMETWAEAEAEPEAAPA